MYMKICIMAAVSVLALSGCSMRQNPQVAENLISIDVDKLLCEEVSIFDIFSEVEVVPLDSKCPLSNTVYTGMSNLAFDGELFYILDTKTLDLCVFKNDGKFVGRADKTGRGPGEYTMADQLVYNPSIDAVEVLDPRGRIYRYSTDSLEFESMLDFSSERLAATHNFFVDGEKYILYSFSNEDKVWCFDTGDPSLFSYGYRPPEYLVKYVSAQSPFFEFDGDAAFFGTLDGLIYVFDNVSRSLVPYIGWDFGKYQGRLSDIPVYDSARGYDEFILDYSRRKLCPFIDMKCSGRKLFASVIYDYGKTYTLYHDMDTGESRLFWKTREGMLFLPELFHDGKMYKYVDATKLPDYVDRGILDDSSQAAYDNVMSENSSAIVKYSLKKSSRRLE